jgi:YesN/AraC family two-component response regulator
VAYSILIVDDDRIFCEEMNELLCDYRTRVALTPTEALSILDEPNEFDLAFLDVRLPEMKGTELLKIIKSRYPDIFVVIMTGYGSKAVILDSMRNKADDFIEKPVNPEEILEVVEKLLQSKRDTKEFSRDIDYVKYYIRKNIDKNVELEDIANIMGYSTKYMSRLFKQETGTNFNDYRLELKMEKAKEYLENTDLRIKQIAYEIGYENSESFVRIFKRKTGFTPSQYRNRTTSDAAGS